MTDKSSGPGCSENLLKNLYIAAPCPVSWDSMDGDDRVRRCGGCAKNVYNLSALSQTEANEFLRSNGVSECMIFFRRADGTIITDNCPVGLRKLRDKWRRLSAVAASVIAFLLSLPSAVAQHSNSDASPGRRFREVPPAREAPPGKQWRHNPAGGGMILVDDKNRFPGTTPPPANPPVNPLLTPGKNGVWELPSSPPILKQQPSKPVKLHAVKTVVPKKPQERTDKSAQEFFRKGEVAEANGETKLAEFFYEKSLDFFDAQSNGDKQFRGLIKRSLDRVRKELDNNTI